MNRLKLVLALALAMAMSTAWGILIPHIVSHIVNRPLEWWHYGIGLVLAHLPDVDAIVEKFVRGQITGAHKKGSYSHYPLLTLPLVFLAVWFVSGFWAVTGVAILLFHYLEDSIVSGPGICWLWPFDHRSFLLIRKRNGQLSFAVPLTNDKLVREHELTLEQWLKRDFFNLSPQGLVNLIVLIVAIVVVSLWR